jgi:hypothetical protein
MYSPPNFLGGRSLIFYGDSLQPLRHCCCGILDIVVGFRFCKLPPESERALNSSLMLRDRVMCLIFLIYGFWEFLGCALNTTSSAGVWKDSGMFDTRGMSLFRALIHFGSCANQVLRSLSFQKRRILTNFGFFLQLIGLRAHAKRDIRRADWCTPKRL